MPSCGKSRHAGIDALHLLHVSSTTAISKIHHLKSIKIFTSYIGRNFPFFGRRERNDHFSGTKGRNAVRKFQNKSKVFRHSSDTRADALQGGTNANRRAQAATKLYHKIFLFFTRWHETTIFREQKEKRAVNQPFSHIVIYSLSFYRFSHIQTRKLFTLSRKHLYYHENSQ